MKEKETAKNQPIPGLVGEAADYHVYSLKKTDRLMAVMIGFGGSIAVFYIFFQTVLLGIIGGILLAVPAQKVYQDYKVKKRQRTLLLQFKDLLESLASSYSAGQNTTGAFKDAVTDMAAIYGDGADIVSEVQLIVTGIENNFSAESLLNNFAQRSGLDDVESFANVFEVISPQGGNLSRVISETREIINDKIEIEMEIDTMLQGNKNELNIMILAPLVVLPMLGGLGGETTITANTAENVIVKLVCIGIFAGAYLLGRKMVDIKV